MSLGCILNFGIPACERLVEQRHPASLQAPALSILFLVNAARDYDIRDAKTNLDELIPAWRELNDALFWYNVEDARCLRDQKDGARVTEWWQARIYREQWKFSSEDIEEAISWIQDMDFQDDKLVALTLAFALYREAGRPQNIRKTLWTSTTRQKSAQRPHAPFISHAP